MMMMVMMRAVDDAENAPMMMGVRSALHKKALHNKINQCVRISQVM
jgi:hypothetical protein